MKVFTTILLSMLVSVSVALAVPQSIEELKTQFPFTAEFDHTADLLTVDEEQDSAVMAKTITSVDGQPFKQCLTVDVKKPGASPYGVSIALQQKHQWKVGETGMIAFYCRTLATQNKHGASSLLLQYKPDYKDWRGYVLSDLFLTKEWKLVMIPFAVKLDAGDTPMTILQLFLGGVEPQTIQLADVHVFSYGEKFPLNKLPQSETYYPGMEKEAAWRKLAHQRIEKHRKANLKLKITDADGKPIPDAQVHIRLKRHQFGFGAAVHSEELAAPSVSKEDKEKYSQILTKTCSKITPTNGMKWKFYPRFKKHVEGLLAWCKENNMTVRGHLFIWPGFERLPKGYDLHKKDPVAFRKDLVDHIQTFANLYPDAFSEWDVMNEPYTEHAYMDLLGKEVVLEWFHTARNANSKYLNYINDFGILSGNNNEHRDIYYEWIDYIIKNKAPLDGIGFQGHYTTPMPPEVILERIDRYAKFGKKMQITEFDFNHTDPVLQARFFEDFVTLIYSHPQMEALINWIFHEDSFRPQAALYRRDFTPTSMGLVWETLITKTWNTDLTLKTNQDGSVSLRGYKGLYDVTVTHQGKAKDYTFNLTQDGEKKLEYTGRGHK